MDQLDMPSKSQRACTALPLPHTSSAQGNVTTGAPPKHSFGASCLLRGRQSLHTSHLLLLCICFFHPPPPWVQSLVAMDTDPASSPTFLLHAKSPPSDDR